VAHQVGRVHHPPDGQRRCGENDQGTPIDISLIQVPYHAGDECHGSSAGPQRLAEAGAVDLLKDQGHRVTVEAADRDGPFRDTASSSAAVNREVAILVRAAVDGGRLPLVLAGSCVTSHGVLAGFEHARCGVVWIDAHADFNTPESGASGFFPGMSLAVITGHCYRHYWSQIGDNTPLAEENVLLLGVRDLSPQAERERLERSAIKVIGWRDGQPEADVTAALDELASHVDEIYLHIDFDGFAPAVAPGTADEPVPGGLSLEQAEAIVRGAAERFRIRAATLATFTPARDEDERTLRLAFRLIGLIAEHARSASA
jgi:arginase